MESPYCFSFHLILSNSPFHLLHFARKLEKGVNSHLQFVLGLTGELSYTATDDEHMSTHRGETS